METMFLDDIPREVAQAAHAHTSHVPEDRAAQERREYAATLREDYEALNALADTDEKCAALEAEFARYREGYRQRYLARLGAMSRCASTMITGGSNFNVRRARKASDAADRRTNELIEYRKRAFAAITKVLRPELAPIMSGDADATERLRAKIAKAEKFQEQMRACNAVIRKHAKAGTDAQVAALVALGIGFGPETARKLLAPDDLGRIGFADYELNNNNANIRRMRSRLGEVETLHATPETSAEGVNARFEDAPGENRVRLHFPGKPSAEVRAELKSVGFRWAPSQGAWSAYRNHSTLAVGRRIAGAP